MWTEITREAGRFPGFWMVIDPRKSGWNKINTQRDRSRDSGLRVLTSLAENLSLKCQGICGPLLTSDLYLCGTHKLVQAQNIKKFFKEM